MLDNNNKEILCEFLYPMQVDCLWQGPYSRKTYEFVTQVVLKYGAKVAVEGDSLNI